jgi:hypothetical protein
MKRIMTHRSWTYRVWLPWLLCFVLTPSDLSAQEVIRQQAREKQIPLPPQKDISDVLIKILHKTTMQRPDSFERKAGKLHFSFIPAAAYTLVTRTAIVLAANCAFYTDDAPQANLSLINSSIAYTQNHQIIFPIHSSFWTKGNAFNFLGDWRFYRYPQYTYGLGGHSSVSNADALRYSYLTLSETIQKMVAPDYFIGLGYHLDYHWDITEAGQGSGIVTDFQKYGKTSSSISAGAALKLLYDDRRNPINPSGGSYASLVYRPNLELFGSQANWHYLQVEYRKYFVFSGQSHNILALWSFNWLTLDGKPPYLDLPSTAWDEYGNVGRGYIQSRLRGRNLVYLECEYRFRLLSNGLLGGVVFLNAQSVSNWPGDKMDTLWPGTGIGLRIKVNKHSNTNMCIDYGFGLEGSNGIFFGLGEMF